MNRLDTLYEMQKQNPNDPFFLYAIGLELQNNNIEETKKIWETLLSDFEDYLPTYYALGKLYEDLTEIDLAKNIYEKGILIATQQKNDKILKELKTALLNADF